MKGNGSDMTGAAHGSWVFEKLVPDQTATMDNPSRARMLIETVLFAEGCCWR
jgi:hypothetical protein